MRRRDFLAWIGGAVASATARRGRAAPGAAHVGFLGAASATRYASEVAALRTGLRELGYSEGENLTLEFRWAEGEYERLPGLARELVDRNVNVIVTHGTPGSLAAEKATSTIPIVMAITGDPVAAGLVTSISRPDRNITGSSFFAPELTAKRIELIKEALPRVHRVAMPSNAENPIMGPVFAAVSHTASVLGIEAQQFPARTPRDLDGVFAAIMASHADALVIPEDGMLIANAKAIAKRASDARLPSIGFRDIAQSGGLMAYGVNIPQTFRHAAVFVDKIIKGARPQDLPIEQAERFELIVNLKAAKSLGLTMPPTLLARADEVIE